MGMNRREIKPEYGDRDPLKQGLGIIKDAGNIYKVILNNQGYFDVPKSDPTGIYVDHVVTDEKAYIKLSPGDDQIWGLKPWKGTYYVRFEGFGGPEDEPPTYYTREARKMTNEDGGTWTLPEADIFTGVFRITGDTPWREINVTKQYEFLFVPQPGTNLADMEGHSTPKGRLETLMELIGDWDWDADSLEWNDDPRLMFQQLGDILTERNGLAKLKINKGWANDLLPHDLEGTGLSPDDELFA